MKGKWYYPTSWFSQWSCVLFCTYYHNLSMIHPPSKISLPPPPLSFFWDTFCRVIYARNLSRYFFGIYSIAYLLEVIQWAFFPVGLANEALLFLHKFQELCHHCIQLHHVLVRVRVVLCRFVSSCVQLPNIVLTAPYRFLGSTSKIVCVFHITQAILLCLVCCYCRHSHEESVTAD